MRAIEEMETALRTNFTEKTKDGMGGYIQMPKWEGTIVVSWGGGWEHVSVAPRKRNIIPSWDDMCYIKNLFWGEDEWVVQYHPPVGQRVNNVPNCLHLWRPIDQEMPTPPSIMTGIREGQSKESAAKEISEVNKKLEEEFEE